jgi:hypothetical protein
MSLITLIIPAATTTAASATAMVCLMTLFMKLEYIVMLRV